MAEEAAELAAAGRAVVAMAVAEVVEKVVATVVAVMAQAALACQPDTRAAGCLQPPRSDDPGTGSSLPNGIACGRRHWLSSPSHAHCCYRHRIVAGNRHSPSQAGIRCTHSRDRRRRRWHRIPILACQRTCSHTRSLWEEPVRCPDPSWPVLRRYTSRRPPGGIPTSRPARYRRHPETASPRTQRTRHWESA